MQGRPCLFSHPAQRTPRGTLALRSEKMLKTEKPPIRRLFLFLYHVLPLHAETDRSVHGSIVRQAHGSPRTDRGTLKINYLAVYPERVEGQMANYDTVSKKGGGS